MKRLLVAAALGLAACLALPPDAACRSLDSMFEEANAAFWNGDYEKAKALYQKLEELGVKSADLAYNLGTAYARRMELGRAIQQYERALRLVPGHANARNNLDVIREYIARRASSAGRDADLAPAVSAWRAVLDRFTLGGAAYGFLIFHVALFLVLIALRVAVREIPRLFLGVFAGILAIVTALSLTVTIGKWHQDNYQKEAIVVVRDQMEVLEGPRSTVKRFGLEEGSRVEILEEQDGWIRLRDAENRDGWVRSGELGKI